MANIVDGRKAGKQGQIVTKNGIIRNLIIWLYKVLYYNQPALCKNFIDILSINVGKYDLWRLSPRQIWLACPARLYPICVRSEARAFERVAGWQVSLKFGTACPQA
mgnify:CR=1 FL=1